MYISYGMYIDKPQLAKMYYGITFEALQINAAACI